MFIGVVLFVLFAYQQLENDSSFDTNLIQLQKKKPCKYFIYKVLVAGAGLEPATFGL